MQHFSKALVGVAPPLFDDEGNAIPDPPTRAALDQAITLASGSSCELTLMSVVDPPSAGFLASDEENEKFAARILQEAEDALKALVKGLNADHIQIETRVVTGQPWHEMTKAVLRENFDVVIAGTRNAGALERLLFGGTGLRLLRNCPCPVWIVKPREDDGETHWLVATQLDDVGQNLLNLAVSGSTVFDAKVHVLHAIEYESARRLGLNAEEMKQHRDEVKQQRSNTLNEQLTHTDYRTTPHGVELVIAEGQPYLSVLEAIEERKIDLLIMGTLGRGGLPGALVGNTAERLLTETPCSILATKPDDFVCPVTLG